MNKNFTPSTLIILLFVLLGSHSKLNAQCANVIINSFTVSTDSVCPGSEVRLYVSTDYSNTVAWDLGNGKKADDRNVSTKYTTAGKYYITCLVTNDCGSDSLLTDSIVVTSAIPYFTLSASPSNKDSICPNEKVNFYAGEHFKSVFWNFDNGSTSNKISVDQKFASVGVHTYTLTITDFCDNDTILNGKTVVRISSKFSGNINIDAPDSVCSKAKMEYYTGGEMQDIRWYFGDGDSLVSSQGEVIHHYENDGKYPVTFVATDFCGVRDTAIDSIVVNSALGPVTDMISKMTDTVCPGFMFYIVTAALRADTFEWNMNDGTILYGDIISHKYATPGMHYFSLRIANSCQHEVILNDSIYVTTNLKTPLDNIDYQMLTTEPCVGDKFTVLSFPYTNMTYILGDGNTVNEQLDSLINYSESPKLYLGLTGISYSAAGTYDISAAVDNGCGVKDTLELGTLEVVDKSQAQAYISLDFLYESGTIVTYMNKPTTFYVGLSSNYDIDYGDGSSKSFSAGSYTIDKHTYTAEGTYTVSLITTNSCGDRDSTGMIVKVIKDPAGYAGVGEIAVDPMNVEAFPNPTNDVVSFKFDKNITENTAFSIYNLQGQLMHQQNINNANKVDFNFAQYSAGIYIASFVSETQNISKRVMLIK